jgi:hypothetical protein
MPDPLAGSIQLIGVAWYYLQDYPRIREIMEDADKLPATYDQWRRGAERGERELKRKGLNVVHAMIDPDEFTVWCREKGLKLDAHARVEFVTMLVSRQDKDRH